MPYIIPRTDPHDLRVDKVEEKVLALNITQSVATFNSEHPNEGLSTGMIMSMVQRAWVVNTERADNCELIFACCKTPDGIPQIIGVFEFDGGSANVENKKFVQSEYNLSPRRKIFLGRPASEQVWNRYVGLFLPKPKQGESNPVRYYE